MTLYDICIVCIYYTGYGEEGTGNWCFKDGTISFQDIFTLYKKHLKKKMLYIFSDCCYSGQWVVDCAKCLDEMGIGACGHQAIEHGILLKVVTSCQPNQKATLGSFVAQELYFNDETRMIHFSAYKKLSDTQMAYVMDFTMITCLQLEGPTGLCQFPDIPAKCSWKWTDIIALELEKRPDSLIHLMHEKARESPAWYYILAERERKEECLKALKTENVDEVTKFGVIIKSGWGEDPPDDIRKAINQYSPSYIHF